MSIHPLFNFYLILILFALGSALSGCNRSQIAKTETPCPSSSEPAPFLQLNYEGDIYKSLQTLEINSTPSTLIFKNENFNFIYCHNKNNWIITEGTYPKSDDYEKQEELANPDYKTLIFQDKIYKYRVFLDPNPFPDFRVEPKQVVFELILPDQSQPQKQILYTLDQVKAKTGIQLGVPQITATYIDKHNIYWAIASEQGEGFSGIATLVRYHPKQNKMDLLQPKGLESQQINDFILTGNENNPTIWLTTQMAGEGNPFLAGMGLVAYSPNSGKYTAYNVRNSPLVGVIPNRLHLDKDTLWVATGNGICHLPWKTPNQFDQWICWRFELTAKIPDKELVLYPSSLSWDVQEILPNDAKEVEVLWWSMTDFYKKKGRYEIVYPKGIITVLPDQGSMKWSDYYANSREAYSWESLIYWPGRDWVWNGKQFIRPFDGVSLNLVGGGPSGFEKWNAEQSQSERFTIRGDLDLLNITEKSTTIKHYSGWVDDSLITPQIKLVPQTFPLNPKLNPLISEQ